MATLNKILLIGNLTREVDLKYIPSGTAVANFGLAINRTYTDSNGEKQEDVCYIDIVAWNIKCRRARGFLQPITRPGAREDRVPVSYLDQPGTGFGNRRAGVVPHGLLASRRFLGKVGADASAIVPHATAAPPVRIAGKAH